MSDHRKTAKIYSVVKKIPRGRVATYGQVARLAGIPRHARQVGYALAVLAGDDIPWHRVVNAKGEISVRGLSFAEDHQRRLLEDENVAFDAKGQISLARFQWRVTRTSREREQRGSLF